MLFKSVSIAIVLFALSACNTNPSSRVEPAESPPVGKILTSDKGMTLYTFNPSTPAICSTGCNVHSPWPFYSYARHDAPSKLATIISRRDGVEQWAIQGNPLHTFSGDKQPGDTNSDGIGGWIIAREPAPKQ